MSKISTLSALLASGHTRTSAASLMGVTPGAVTQMAESLPSSTEEQLERSSALDAQYDAIEDKLLKQLDRTIPLLLRPAEIARTLQIINGAKRRGVSASLEQVPSQVLVLNLPQTIQNKFVVNSSNQVVSAGTQDLVTIPSAAVPKLLESSNVPAISKNTPTKSKSATEDEFGV